jgi:hypothetical protein
VSLTVVIHLSVVKSIGDKVGPVPGNKDGDVRVNPNENSLEAFVNNFCAKTQAVTHFRCR